MKVAFEPARPRVRTMMITVSSDEGHEHATWIAGVARKYWPDGKCSLIVLLGVPGANAGKCTVRKEGIYLEADFRPI